MGDNGHRNAARKAWQVLSQRYFRRMYYRQQDLIMVKNLQNGATRPQNEAIRIRAIDPRDDSFFDRVRLNNPEKNVIARLKSYLQNGYSGVQAEMDNAVIGYIWWVSRKVDPAKAHPHLTRYEIALADDEVYMFDYFLIPEYRRHGNAVAVLRSVEDELRRQGYQRHWGVVDATNRPARWLYSSNGHEIKHRLTFRLLFSRYLFNGQRIFVKNSARDQTFPFDFRLVFPRR
jgi:GNAT superfamily N-acetyltransferase